jgi:hypothetical protein
VPGRQTAAACQLAAAAVRNDIDEAVIVHTFTAWRIEQMQLRPLLGIPVVVICLIDHLY